MQLSLILPIYNEVEQLPHTLRVVDPILASCTTDYEIIVVNDGSLDGSWQLLKELSISYPHLKGINFSRNFGKEAAMAAGLKFASGQAVILMDADLQHPAELIRDMYQAYLNGFEVVEAVKSHRGKESKFYKFFALRFYKLFNFISGVNLNNASDFKLLDRKVVNAWLELNERTTFFRGLVAWLGFKKLEIPFIVQNRLHGESKWSFKQLFRLALQAMIGFSARPLYLIFWLGLIFVGSGLILAIHTLVMFITGRALEGFTTVILLQLIIGGSILTSLGIIGVYLAQIFEEIKGRPRFVISETAGFN